MEFLVSEGFTEIQKSIIEMKINDLRLTWDKWIQTIHEEHQITLNPKSLSRFIVKTAMGYPWEPNDTGGRPKYLNPQDFNALKNECLAICNAEPKYINICDFMDMALELKTTRIINAHRFLVHIGSTKLAFELTEDDDLEPSRQWVTTTVKEMGLVLETPEDLEEARFNAASKRILKDFMQKHEEIITQCPLDLLFGADETMFKAILRGKVITLKEHYKIVRKQSNIPHITGVCTHSVTGASPPPFIILPGSLQNLPTELDEFNKPSIAWFASNKSGWMTRDLFLIYIIHFINWLSEYRKSLPASIRDATALLITDGHGSRECPLALMLLRV